MAEEPCDTCSMLRRLSGKVHGLALVGILLSSVAMVGSSGPPVVAASTFVSLTPATVYDTTGGDKVGSLDFSGETIEIQIGGNGGVPSSGVSAVGLNVAAISPEANSFGATCRSTRADLAKTAQTSIGDPRMSMPEQRSSHHCPVRAKPVSSYMESPIS